MSTSQRQAIQGLINRFQTDFRPIELAQLQPESFKLQDGQRLSVIGETRASTTQQRVIGVMEIKDGVATQNTTIGPAIDAQPLNTLGYLMIFTETDGVRTVQLLNYDPASQHFQKVGEPVSY